MSLLTFPGQLQYPLAIFSYVFDSCLCGLTFLFMSALSSLLLNIPQFGSELIN